MLNDFFPLASRRLRAVVAHLRGVERSVRFQSALQRAHCDAASSSGYAVENFAYGFVVT
jgi:hypothetical protein